MPGPAKIGFDVASGLLQGRRDVQEDALASEFNADTGAGYAVLADGMGGHEAGDVASKIVVAEVFNELNRQSPNFAKPGFDISGFLTDAAKGANERLRVHSATNPETYGMGATLIATLLLEDRLFWISIGDSPLYVFRNGRLRQINEDHSLAPQIDYMAQSGVISESAARDHPDRNCLISVLNGDDIAQIDCPQDPFVLLPNDVVIAASDGLQFLSDNHIEEIIGQLHENTSAEVMQYLMDEIENLDDPHQDNLSISVIRILDPVNAPRECRSGEELPGPQNPVWAKSAAAADSATRPVLARVKRMFSAFANSLSKNALR